MLKTLEREEQNNKTQTDTQATQQGNRHEQNIQHYKGTGRTRKERNRQQITKHHQRTTSTQLLFSIRFLPALSSC